MGDDITEAGLRRRWKEWRDKSQNQWNIKTLSGHRERGCLPPLSPQPEPPAADGTARAGVQPQIPQKTSTFITISLREKETSAIWGLHNLQDQMQEHYYVL